MVPLKTVFQQPAKTTLGRTMWWRWCRCEMLAVVDDSSSWCLVLVSHMLGPFLNTLGVEMQDASKCWWNDWLEVASKCWWNDWLEVASKCWWNVAFISQPLVSFLSQYSLLFLPVKMRAHVKDVACGY